MFSRMLVATDGSALSRQTVAAAIALARSCGAAIVALSVAEPAGAFVLTDGAMVVDAGADTGELTGAASAHVRAVADAAVAAGVDCRTIVAVGDCPWEEILRASARHGCDLIFMGSHGRRGLGRILVGSQTQKVLEGACVPVLVYRPPTALPG